MAIPLPLLVLPWVLALAVWLAFPWLARRSTRADQLRWLPPGLVLAGGALLWLSASNGTADGHDDRAAEYLAAASALCDARAALPGERAAAVRAFQNGAHDTLHTLASDPTVDRRDAGTLLRAKQAVESAIAEDAPGSALEAPVEALIIATDAALADLGIRTVGCAS